MDDLEFSARAHADPDDTRQDFLAALSARPDRQKILNEIKLLDEQLKTLSAALYIPPQLRHRLRPPAQVSWLRRSAYAMAASLVLAVGFVVSSLPYRPNAEELAMHDSMLEHLVHEEPRYIDAQPIQWSEVEAVLSSANIRMQAPEGDNTLVITFAKLCGLAGGRRAVHLVAIGEQGPVSVLLIQAPPVGGAMEVKDPRFKGHIMPAAVGNMAIIGEIGEKDENLGRLENLITNSVQWSI